MTQYLNRQDHQQVDASLIRIMCKLLRLSREIHAVGGKGDQWPRLRWIAAHLTSAQKEAARSLVAMRLEEMACQLEMDESFEFMQQRLAEVPPGPERELLKSLKEIRVRPLRKVLSMLDLICQKAPRRHRDFAIELHHALKGSVIAPLLTHGQSATD